MGVAERNSGCKRMTSMQNTKASDGKEKDPLTRSKSVIVSAFCIAQREKGKKQVSTAFRGLTTKG